MKGEKIEPDDLVKALTDYCRGYTDEIKSMVGDKLETIGEEAVSDVKKLAPVYVGANKRTPKGSYRRSWTYRVDKERGKISVTVYASGKNYRLTHLLENGHLTRDGRTRSKAIPHIAPANERAQKKAEKLLEDL